ncbi:MAG: hypothetical protein OXC63_08190 [Aestuariivita sp.]|nr:hypothetical protein [Aestuariivita sp.]MCY4345370.1 hypothetical protein [Aestuariivita sp.]
MKKKVVRKNAQQSVKLGKPMTAFWQQQKKRFAVRSIEEAMRHFIEVSETNERLIQELTEKHEEEKWRLLESEAKWIADYEELKEKGYRISHQPFTDDEPPEFAFEYNAWASQQQDEALPFDEFEEEIDMMRPESDPRAR